MMSYWYCKNNSTDDMIPTKGAMQISTIYWCDVMECRWLVAWISLFRYAHMNAVLWTVQCNFVLVLFICMIDWQSTWAVFKCRWINHCEIRWKWKLEAFILLGTREEYDMNWMFCSLCGAPNKKRGTWHHKNWKCYIS